jgi:hypothetical protein
VPGTDLQQHIGELLGAGYAALALGQWDESRDCFESALEHGETPEALEGLAMAAHFVDDVPVVIASRERAYLLYRERGDRRGAARLACMLANAYGLLRGDDRQRLASASPSSAGWS